MEINKKNKAVQLKDENENEVFVELKKVNKFYSEVYFSKKKENEETNSSNQFKWL